MNTLLTTAILLTSLALPANAINRTPEPHASPLEISEPTPLDIYIERLAFLESSGRETIVILDSNKRLSKSCLQFQDATFEEQTKKYGLAGDIMDCNFQKHLAKAMLSDNPKNIRHWLGSSRVLGVPPVPGHTAKAL